MAGTRSKRDLADDEESNMTIMTVVPVCCRRCRYRRVKRGKLASMVLVPRRALRVWFDLGASIYVFLELMIVPDTFLALISSVSSVFIFEEYLTHLAISLNWSAVSFMIAFPLQNAIREAYKRREVALQALVEFRGVALNVYLANTLWDWPGAETYNGRGEDGRPKEEGGKGKKKKPCDIPLPAEHRERIRTLIFRIFDALQELLLVPRAGHARNEFMCGKDELYEVDAAMSMGRDAVLTLLGRLHRSVEDLKAAGMPANEASRINQYNMMLVRDFERLWSAKTYYTPIALRALLRVVIQLLPFFYGPYWLYVARGTDGEKTPASLAFATVFSCMISLLLISLVNLEEQMENPFKHASRDAIHLTEEMALARRMILKADEDTDNHAWHSDFPFEWQKGHSRRLINAGEEDDSSSEESYDPLYRDSHTPHCC